MAWEAYTSDTILDFPGVVLGNMSARVRLAYRLYCDDSVTDNPPIRLEVTYVHMHMEVNTESVSDDGYWNALSVGWFLGTYPDMFNQTQYDLNSQRDDDGYYVNTFAWPYYSSANGTSQEPGPDFSFASAVSDLQKVLWSQTPVVSVATKNNVNLLSRDTFSFGTSTDDLSANSNAVAWGSVFSNKSMFSGVNVNGQSKVVVTNTSVDVATSSVKTKDGTLLQYDDEFNYNVDELEVSSPYTSTQCFASVETSKTELEQKGLVKYDPNHFVEDDVSSTYLVNGWVVPFSYWTRVRSGNESVSLLSRYSSSEMEVELKAEEISLPEYDPPDPIKPVDDNKVFALKRKTDSGGHTIVDQNGNPVLTWVRCERIGQE